MRLRTRLFQLVAGAVVPLVLLAIVLGGLAATRQQATYSDGARDRMRALMTAVDAELRGHFRAIETLGASRSLSNDDLASFYQDAGPVLASQSDWQNITLALPGGQQLIHLGRPFGTNLEDTPDLESLREVVRTREPAVGNVFFGATIQRYGVPVRVPVFDSGGQLKYVLTAVIDPETFGALILEQDLPPTWVSGLIDATGHFIGRVPALSHDDMASEDFLAATRGSREGWFRGLTVERVDTFTAFIVSDISQWSLGIAIPATVVNAGARSAIWIIVFGVLLSMAIALGFTYFLGRRIATPISRLARSARALGQGGTLAAQSTEAGIHEVREVAKALNEAAEAIGERHALLTREQSALREADRVKDEFLAMLGHELRNPLGAITSAVQVLSVAEPGKEMAVQSQAVIERQTRHMTRLIEDLLDVSGLTMGKMTLRREPFNLARLVTRATRTWERSDASRTGTVEISADEVWVNADRVRIEQVLLNLLDNASKFAPADRVVQIRVGKEGANAVLAVTDEGDGIAADQLAQVFNLFVQGPRERVRLRRGVGGMGVGLALVKRLVELHGGTVEAVSAGPGRGATFSVRLPAVEAAQTVDQVDITSTRNQALPVLRILVTEDNDDAREMMRSMLTLDGHEVRVACDGAGTLVALEEWCPDVALMDIGLPDMEGYDVARRIGETELRRRIRLIALTGFGQIRDEQRAYEAGFDIHLSKPVTPEVLREVLAALTRDRREG